MKTEYKFLKIFWGSLFLISVASSSYFIIINILEYLRFETVTSIEVIYEHNSQFPTISFCRTTSSGFNLTHDLLYCEFNSLNCSLDDNFESFVDVAYGSCYRFNSGRNKTGHKVDILNSSLRGIEFSFKLKLDLEPTEGYDFGELVVFIHNHSEKPFNMLDKGFYISTGSFNFIILEKI